MQKVSALLKLAIFGGMRQPLMPTILGSMIHCGASVARLLLDTLVDFSREKNLKIIPTCSYVDVMFRRDKSFEDVAA
jgi:hypothetical protein